MTRVSSPLSLLPPSSMVAPNRELANTQFPFDISSTSNPQAHLNKAMDMDIDTPRGWSANSSTNNSRESSTHSSVSSIAYADRVQALNNSPSWADLVKSSESQEEITLSYANPEMPFLRCPFLELTSPSMLTPKTFQHLFLELQNSSNKDILVVKQKKIYHTSQSSVLQPGTLSHLFMNLDRML